MAICLPIRACNEFARSCFAAFPVSISASTLMNGWFSMDHYPKSTRSFTFTSALRSGLCESLIRYM